MNDKVAFRLNGFEDSDSFRDAVGLKRYGVTPTLTIAPSTQTTIAVRYEHLHHSRVADRGIPSFQGRPVDVDIATFYGDPSASDVRANVDVVSAIVEHRVGSVTVRNHTMFGDYNRFYQNFVPVFDKRYYINADGNTNISPGFPRTLRVGLTTTF